MLAVTVVTTIRSSHLKRPGQSEGDHRIPWDPHSATTRFATVNRADNTADQTIIPVCVDALRFRFNPITLTVHYHRIKIESQVVIRCDPHDQFDAGSARDDYPAIVPPNILVDCAVINPIIALV
jgi:hypothetical protein